MPRYVLLRHDHPALHWDFMLDAGAALWTWRLTAPPDDVARPAERIADHRRLYLDYEGPVSGDRGTVWREAAGEFEWLTHDDDRVEVRLSGDLIGVLRLVRGTAQLDAGS